MSTHKVIKRKPTPQEITYFIKEIRSTPNIIGYTNKEWHQFKNVWIAEIDGKPVGFAVNKDISREWSETSMIYVLKDYRRRGIGKSLFCAAIHAINASKRKAYYVSRNPIVLKWMQEENMIFSKATRLPFILFLHSIKKGFSFYRAREFVRKYFLRNNKNKFIHAYK